MEYTVTSEVTDYYYSASDNTFSDTAPDSAGKSDLKLLELTVSWGLDSSIQIDGSTATTTGNLGSGRIRLTDMISSITSPSGGKVVLNASGEYGNYAPPVDYTQDKKPGIISISLGANKFKVSTTPLPDIIRTDELVETRFDVVTYSQSDSGATFLRREEISDISCECIFKIP